jgi:hypothetical protein
MESDDLALGPARAAAQLAALQADREAMAARAVQPWWYDVLLGLLTFGFVSSYATHNVWVILAAVVLFLAACQGLVAVYQRLTGLRFSGNHPGPTRRAIHVWLVVYGVVMVVAAAAEFLLDVRGSMVVGGAVLGVTIALVSRWWTRIYVSELRGEL